MAAYLDTCGSLQDMQRISDLAVRFEHPLAAIGPAWIRELIEFDNPYDHLFGRLSTRYTAVMVYDLAASDCPELTN